MSLRRIEYQTDNLMVGGSIPPPVVNQSLLENTVPTFNNLLNSQESSISGIENKMHNILDRNTPEKSGDGQSPKQECDGVSIDYEVSYQTVHRIFHLIKKNIVNDEMTRKEIEDVPNREWQEDIGEFDTLVILPTRQTHDSGYRCMDFVAVKKGVPIKRLGGGSDVIHLDGIGGYGENWLQKYGTCPSRTEPSGWNIDCLKVSGLLQLFTHGVLTCGDALSSFEIYTKRK